MTVILDTNVLIVSVLPRFRFHWVFEALLAGRYDLALSNEIVAEYEEQLGKRFGLSETERQLDFLLMLPNVHYVTPYFQWELMTNDTDDNKFVDCAVAANADFIVTEDKHFRILQEVSFPKVDVIGIDEFQYLILS